MINKKKIYIILGHSVIIPTYKTGGIEKLYQELIKQINLPNNIDLILIGRGKKKNIISLGKNKYIITLEGYDWTKNKFKNLFYSFLWIKKVSKIIRNSSLTIYNTPFGVIWDKSCGISKVVAIVDHRGTGKLKFLNIFADRIYVVSKTVKSKWPKYFYKKIKLIYNGINLDKFVFKTRYKNVSNINNIYNIIFLGRIVPEKGLEKLVEAIDILIHEKKLFNIRLNIIGSYSYEKGGDENYYNKINNFIKERGLEKYIKFLGEKTTEEIINIFHNSHIMVTPSVWPEAFGIVNIEAMATGLPVIGFNIGALSEIIEDKKNGFLVKDIGNSMELANRIFLHYNLSIKEKINMEYNAFMSAKNFDISKIGEEYKNDFLNLLNIKDI